MGIYEEGSTIMYNYVLEDGFCAYTKKTPEEYIKEVEERENIKLKCLPIQEIDILIKEAEDKKYLKNWTEIKEEEFEYYLEVLPPKNWKTYNKNNIEIFHMSEYMTGSITRYCIREREKYYSTYRREDSNENILKEFISRKQEK